MYWRRYTCHTDTPRLEFRRSASEWVCRHFIPRSWSRGVLLVLAGYIDGSNLHGGNVDVVSVGGCAANAELWKIWENKWDDLLQFGGISKWDHAKFMAGWKPGKPAQRWSESERPIARRLLCESFEAIRPAYVGATVRLTDYNELRTQYNSLPEDPYYFLLDRCMQRLIQGMFEYPHNEGMAVL